MVESAPGCGQMKFTRQDIGMIDLHAYHTHIHMRTRMHACMHACVRAHTHAHTHTRSLTAHGPWEIPPQAHDTHTRGRKRERERERERGACCCMLLQQQPSDAFSHATLCFVAPAVMCSLFPQPRPPRPFPELLAPSAMAPLPVFPPLPLPLPLTILSCLPCSIAANSAPSLVVGRA